MDNSSSQQQVDSTNQIQQQDSINGLKSQKTKGRRNRKARNECKCDHHVHCEGGKYDSLQANIFAEWRRAIMEDDVFEGEEDENLWIVDDTNAMEIIEALNYQYNDYLTEEELMQFIEEEDEGASSQKNKIVEPSRKTWAQLKFKIYNLVVEVKKIQFKDLIHEWHSLHIERVSRFLNILKREISLQPAIPHQVKDWFLGEIKFTKQKINENTLFQSQIEQQKIAYLKERKTIGGNKGRMSVRMQWMNEFSDIALETLSQNNLSKAKEYSDNMDYHTSSKGRQKKSQFNKLSLQPNNSSDAQQDENKSKNSKSETSLLKQLKENIEEDIHEEKSSSSSSDYMNFGDIQDMQMSLTKAGSVKEDYNLTNFEQHLQGYSKIDFNVLELSRQINRQKVLSILTVKSLSDLDLLRIMDQNKLYNFLNKIQDTYDTRITYHNDLHGADVMQMSFHMMTELQMIEILHMDKLDCMSMIIAAGCHDLGHDGFNNNYHVNAITKRAIDCNDQSVQETFHAAELFRILNTPGYNFIEDLHREQFASFRKRVMGLIMATDMAKHAQELTSLNEILTMNENENKTIEEAFFSKDFDLAHIYKNQQQLMEFGLHAADISQACRNFEEVKEWTYLLFEEFFEQGDIEKEEGLPVSMLCDRETTNVAKCQPGFINFVTFPLFSCLSKVLPNLLILDGGIDRMKENKRIWTDYVETEEDKKVYQKNRDSTLKVMRLTTTMRLSKVIKVDDLDLKQSPEVAQLPKPS